MCTDTHIRTCLIGVVDTHNRGKQWWLRKVERKTNWKNRWKDKEQRDKDQLTFSLSVRDTRAASPDPWAAWVSVPCVMLRFGWLWLLLFGLLGRFMCHGNLLLVQCKSVGHSLLLPQQPGPVIASCYRHLWHLQAEAQFIYFFFGQYRTPLAVIYHIISIYLDIFY